MFCSFLWFVKITKIDCHGNENGRDTDDYGHDFPPEAKFLKGHFRKVGACNNCISNIHAFHLSQPYTQGHHIYTEEVVYPFLDFEPSKTRFNLK